MAGAFVAAVSFRRMGQPQKASKTLFYTLSLCIAFLIPFLLAIPPDAGMKKIIVLALEGAGYRMFPSILREDYVKWKASNPGVSPRNDWAATGWGILGALMFLAIAALILMFRR